jgi:predicted alpha/beta-fold hydrolase
MNVIPFKPAWWLRGPHSQTLWSTLFRRREINIPLRRERIELADGDFVDLDWSPESHGPIVLILHGLEGSVASPYVKGMLQTLHQHGWRAVVMHFRGCSGESNRLPRIYHSGDTDDIAEVVSLLKEREPFTPIAAMGFSMGGNVLLKWLGEMKDSSPLAAAIAISVPYDLNKSVEKLQSGFSRLYQWHLLRSLKQKILTKFCKQASPIPLPPLMNVRSIREFDDKITAPLHGFGTAKNYYQMASCKPYLRSIHVPTLLLQAKDDPFMTPDVIPRIYDLSPTVKLELSERGGHVGFVGGLYPWRPQYWLEYRIPLFLKHYLPSRVSFGG